MRVRRALVLGSVLVLFQHVVCQDDPSALPSIAELVTALDYQAPPDQDCVPDNTWCPTSCKTNGNCENKFWHCLKNKCGGCECQNFFQCRPNWPFDPDQCPHTCYNDQQCEERLGLLGATCIPKLCGACDCVGPAKCVAEPKVPSWCPNDCETINDCEDPVNNECQKNPCGGCHCLPKETEKKKDCCYEDSSDSCSNECAYDSDCPGGRDVCVEDPSCQGGCICDQGEGCHATIKPPNATCPDECTYDEDCKKITGGACLEMDCGGCRCAQPDKRGCCPDMMIKPGCPKECETHEDCKDKMKVCRRNDCGGCSCRYGEVPWWANCFPNPNMEPTTACPQECYLHSQCYKGEKCVRMKCGGCMCKRPTITDVVLERANPYPPIP